jgi:hypothetical protein
MSGPQGMLATEMAQECAMAAPATPLVKLV